MTDLPEFLRRNADNVAPFMVPRADGPDKVINPADSPPATSLNWAPPWASKSGSHDA